MKTIRNEQELLDAKEVLVKMEESAEYVTVSAYRANSDLWPDHRISFIDNHLYYLKTHPDVSVKLYISNLRLKLRKSPIT